MKKFTILLLTILSLFIAILPGCAFLTQPEEEKSKVPETSNKTEMAISQQSLNFTSELLEAAVANGTTAHVDVEAKIRTDSTSTKTVQWSVAWMGDSELNVADYVTIEQKQNFICRINCLKDFAGYTVILTARYIEEGVSASIPIYFNKDQLPENLVLSVDIWKVTLSNVGDSYTFDVKMYKVEYSGTGIFDPVEYTLLDIKFNVDLSYKAFNGNAALATSPGDYIQVEQIDYNTFKVTKTKEFPFYASYFPEGDTYPNDFNIELYATCIENGISTYFKIVDGAERYYGGNHDGPVPF